MINIPPCDLPMVPLVPMVPLAVENVQGFLVTIGKNGTVDFQILPLEELRT